MADHTCGTDTPYPRFLRDLCYSFFSVFVHVEYSLSLSFCSILTSDHVSVFLLHLLRPYSGKRQNNEYGQFIPFQLMRMSMSL
jgi:hypothetical protein